MAERRRPTPDVLGDVLAHQHTSTPVPQQNRAPAEEKVKATFYFRPRVLEALEEAWFRLHKAREWRQLNKSVLADVCLEYALAHLDDPELVHLLARALASQSPRKP